MIGDLKRHIETFVWGDRLSRHGIAGRALAIVLRYLYAVMRDVFSGQLTLRAMSLVYTTLLSIVPLLAFSFSVLKGFGVHNRVAVYLYGVLEPLGDTGRQYTDQILSLVDSINVKALAGLGLAFFIYTVISMVQKTEESFNYVWYVSEPRSFARRFVEYVFVLLIGPVFIFIALGLISVLQSATLVQYVVDNTFFGPVIAVLGQLTPYLIVIGVFSFLYMFMPNTRVRLTAALVGGIAGGFLWASISLLFATFVVDSVRTNAIYAGFAVPISALIWVYLNWLVLLIGAQLAFYFQNPAYLRVGRREPRLSNGMRERLALNIMLLVGREFRDPGSGITLRSLSRSLKIPSLTLAPVADALEEAGLLAVGEDEQLRPGREMSRIRLADVLAVVRDVGDTGSLRSPVWSTEVQSLAADIDRAANEAVRERTLADLLDVGDAPDDGDESASGAGDGHAVDKD